MSLRITSRRESKYTVIQVDGQLRDEGVEELERIVAGVVGPLRLELSGLRSADEAGLAALRALRARGSAVAGASPYIALLLDPEGAPPGTRPASRRRDRDKLKRGGT